MSNINWNFTRNVFEVSTRNSAKKMTIIASDHLSKLRARSTDPQIAAIIAATELATTNFNNAYSHRLTCRAAYRGQTNRFTQMLTELSNLKIKQWDVQVQTVYLEGTSQYLALFPNNKAPFQRGAYDIRLSHVYALVLQLADIPSLATLHASVLAYYTQLLNARNVQQQKEGHVNKASQLLEDARIQLAYQMYINLATLMLKYYKNTSSIESFFELGLIRPHKSAKNKGNTE